MLEVIAEGTSQSLQSLANNPATSGELHIITSGVILDDVLAKMQSDITAQGVKLTAPITQDAGVVVIKFDQGASITPSIGFLIPLAIITASIVTLGGVITGWQVVRKVEAVPKLVWVGLGSVLFLLILMELRKNDRKPQQNNPRRRSRYG